MGKLDASIQKTEEVWGVLDPERSVWNLPFSQDYILRQMGGVDAIRLIRGAAGKDTFDRALALGTGHGESDRGWCGANMFREHIGLDVAHGAVKSAQDLADAEGMPLKYVRADLNKPLPATVTGSFDLVYAFASLHHIDNLEVLFRGIRDRLTPDGLFTFVEYCGPSRFQHRDKVLKICNAVLSVLPPELKGEFAKVVRPTSDVFDGHDPSEAIRSAEIMDMTNLYFDVVVEKDLGFTLTQPLVNPIVRHFDAANPLHDTILRLIFLMEELLMENSVIESDVKFVVARKRA